MENASECENIVDIKKEETPAQGENPVAMEKEIVAVESQKEHLAKVEEPANEEKSPVKETFPGVEANEAKEISAIEKEKNSSPTGEDQKQPSSVDEAPKEQAVADEAKIEEITEVKDAPAPQDHPLESVEMTKPSESNEATAPQDHPIEETTDAAAPTEDTDSLILNAPPTPPNLQEKDSASPAPLLESSEGKDTVDPTVKDAPVAENPEEPKEATDSAIFPDAPADAEEPKEPSEPKEGLKDEVPVATDAKEVVITEEEPVFYSFSGGIGPVSGTSVTFPVMGKVDEAVVLSLKVPEKETGNEDKEKAAEAVEEKDENKVLQTEDGVSKDNDEENKAEEKSDEIKADNKKVEVPEEDKEMEEPAAKKIKMPEEEEPTNCAN